MASLLALPVVPKSLFAPPTAPAGLPLPVASAKDEAAEGPLIDGADDLMAALSCADDLLAGITDLHEVSAEVDEAEERHEPAGFAPESEGPAAAEAPVVFSAPARKAPPVPSARKPFSAPPTAKPAALLCADADVDADADGAALVAAKVEVPRLKSAFVRFSAVRRVVLKAEMPELSVADISKVLGAEWSKLDQEAKAPYVAAAEAEKSSVLLAPKKPVIKLTSAAKPAGGAAKKAVAGDAEPKPPRPITAYVAFCSERRAELKLEQPDLPFGEVSKTIGAEWKNLSDEERLPFALRAAERSAERAAAPLQPAKASKKAKATKRAAPSSPDLVESMLLDDADLADSECGIEVPPAKKYAVAGYDWGEDRSKPVSFLISRLMSGSFVALRQAGDVPTEEIAVAVRDSTATGGEAAEAEVLLHSEEQEHELAIHLSKFKAALSERAVGHAIDLDGLGPDSPLGTMLVLEALRAKGGPLDQDVVKRNKNVLLGANDTVIKVPAIGLSFIVDRLISGAVQTAVAAERARVAGLGAPAEPAPLVKELRAEPSRAAMEE